MAEIEDLKQMVLNFRRADLIELLGFVGHNKAGTKATLQQRALALVQSARGFSLPVQIKIRDIYRNIHNPFADDPRTRSRTSSSDSRLRIVEEVSGVTFEESFQNLPIELGRRVPVTKLTQPHGLGSSLSQASTGAIDYRKQHGAADALSPGGSVIPVHPDVTFKRLPFYDIMGELLKPTSLVPRGQSRYQETYFVFHLTPQQAQDIAMSRDFRPAAKFEYTVQIQLRFCFLETSCEQDDNFPPSICVRVNGKMAQLPNPIPTTKPGVEPKRPGRPVDITSLCRISPTMPNHIEISWGSEFGRGYCVSVNLVKRLTSDILLQRLKQFGNRHADHTRALIKEKLQHDPDSEIATTSLRVSLICPLGKMRMQLPCRAQTCSHLQCFDAITFLMMNEKKPTWNCPVCDKPTPFHKLIIDGLFVEILKKLSDVSEIQFLEDGSWSPIRANKESYLISSPAVVKTATRTVESVDLCEDSVCEPSFSASPTKKPKTDDVIDLTETDSEDEEPQQDTSQNISSGSSSPIPAMNSSSPSPSLSHIPSPTATSGRGSSPSVLRASPALVPSPLALTPNRAHQQRTSPAVVPSSPIIPNRNSPQKGTSTLPPMPPLCNYQKKLFPSTNGLHSSQSSSKHTSPTKEQHEPHSPPPYSPNRNLFSSSGSVPTTTSWLTALSETTHGQKRPPPAHTGSALPPPAKRPYLDHLNKSPSQSPNSNMSPLVELRRHDPLLIRSDYQLQKLSLCVRKPTIWFPGHKPSCTGTEDDLDQLCHLLDNDRSSSSEEVSIRFPSDYSVTGSSAAAAQSRTIFNISPSDIISLD